MVHYTFFGYMLAVAIIMLLCTIGYRLFLERFTQPQFNRVALLSIYLISLLIPVFISLFPDTSVTGTIGTGQLDFLGLVPDGDVETIKTGFSFPSIMGSISRVYLGGMIIGLILTIVSMLNLLILKRKAKIKAINGTEVYVHDNERMSSFSWMNKIFIYKGALEEQENNLDILISHERAHLDRGHWIDLAVAQLVLIFQWFNPAAWFIRKELQRVHEYESDHSVLKSGIDEKTYQMLLIRNISGNRYSGLTDGLNNCSLKKRIIMMKKTKFSKSWLLRGIVVGGFAILGGLIIHIPAVATTLTSREEPEIKVVKVSTEPRNTVVVSGEGISNGDYRVFVDGKEISREEMSQINPDDITKITVKKDTDPGEVLIETKEGAGRYSTISIDNPQVGTIVKDKIAEYEGGMSGLMNDLIKNTKYPEEAVKAKIEGAVVVRFQVNPNGTMSNYEIVNSANPLLDNAALAAVKNLPGKWKPVEVDGKPVASLFTLPVNFKLSSGK